MSDDLAATRTLLSPFQSERTGSGAHLKQRRNQLVVFGLLGATLVCCLSATVAQRLYRLPDHDELQADFPGHRAELECFRDAIESLPPGTILTSQDDALIRECSSGYIKCAWGKRERWELLPVPFLATALAGGAVGFTFVEPPATPTQENNDRTIPLEHGWYIWSSK